MIHVAKNGNHRWPNHQVGLVILKGSGGFGSFCRCGRLGHSGTDSQRSGHQSGDLIVDHLVHGRHNPIAHQLLDHVNGILVQNLRQILDRHRLR